MAEKLSSAPVWPTIAVRDIEASRRFYEEVLGYKPSLAASEVVVYNGPGETGLSIYHSDENARTNKATYAGWIVDDLSQAMSILGEKGVKFEEYDVPDMHRGVATWRSESVTVKTAWFKDPDGNILSITEQK